MLAASSGKESCQYAFVWYPSAWPIYSFQVRALRPFRTSPGSWGFPSDHSKVLAQMRLIHKSTSKRNVAQGRMGRKHALGGQFHATSHQENVRRLPEGALEGA